MLIFDQTMRATTRQKRESKRVSRKSKTFQGGRFVIMSASQNASPNPAGSPSKSRGSGEEAGSPVAALFKIQPALNPLFVYGVKPEVHGGIFFSGDNTTLLYPSGCGISLYDSKVEL